MKQSAVNRHMFIRDVKRSWPVWVGMGLVYAMAYIPAFIWRFENFVNNNYTYLPDGGRVKSAVYDWSMSLNETAVFAVIADFLLVLFIFGFMNNARSANFHFSLPLKRGSMFLTKLLACVTVTFIPALIAGIIPVIYTGGLAQAWYLMLYLMLAHVTFLGMALLCVVLIGQSVAFAAISTIVQFAPIMILEVTRSFLRTCLYGYSYGGTSGVLNDVIFPIGFFTSLSTNAWRNGRTSFEQGLISIIILTLLGVVCGVLAYLTFKKRRAESAGDIVVFKGLRPVFKYCIAVLSAMFFTYIMISSFGMNSVNEKNLITVCIMVVFNTALGYFIAEMLIQKKFNIFRDSWRGFAVTAAVLVVVTGCIELDVFGLETRVPAAADVEHAFISSSMSAGYTEPEDIANLIALHEFLISQKAVAESSKSGMAPVSLSVGNVNFSPYEFQYGGEQSYEGNAYQYMNSHFPSYMNITYVLKNGKTLQRSYSPSTLFFDQNATEELGRLYYAITHTYACANQQLFNGLVKLEDNYSVNVNSGNISVNLDRDMSAKLYDAILADMKDLHIGVDQIAPPEIKPPVTLMNSWITIIDNTSDREVSSYSETITGDFPMAMSSYKSVFWQVMLDTRAVRTLELLEEWEIEVS